MRIRRKKWARPELEVCSFYINNPNDYKGKWKTLFKKEQPIHLELGCGKGQFIAQLASKHPEINYIAMDIKCDMLGYANRNILSEYSEKGLNIENVLIVYQNIEQISNSLDSSDTIERIYINFCNPWPKSQHKKRRLTYHRQLDNYKIFLINGGEIYFKTDDDNLFEESIKYFEDNGFEISEKTYDLHNNYIFEDIKTEHENMFSQVGIKIKALIAKKL